MVSSICLQILRKIQQFQVWRIHFSNVINHDPTSISQINSTLATLGTGLDKFQARSRRTKPLSHAQFFGRAHFYCKKEKNRSANFRSKSQSTCDILMFKHLMTSKLSYFLGNCETFNYLPSLEQVRGVFRTPSNIYMELF